MFAATCYRFWAAFLDVPFQFWANPPSLAETYSDARYCKHATSKDRILQHRIKGPYGHLGTVMAKYGSQHTLHPSALLRSGLHTDLTGSLQRPRFFSPLELALALGTFGTLKLPRNCRSAHHMVGNAIAPMQALQVLLPIMCLLTKIRICAPVSHPQDILMNAWTLRLRASQTNVIESASWIGLMATGSSSPAESHSEPLHAIPHARANSVPESIADDGRPFVSDIALSMPPPRNVGVLSTQVPDHPSEIVCSPTLSWGSPSFQIWLNPDEYVETSAPANSSLKAITSAFDISEHCIFRTCGPKIVLLAPDALVPDPVQDLIAIPCFTDPSEFPLCQRVQQNLQCLNTPARMTAVRTHIYLYHHDRCYRVDVPVQATNAELRHQLLVSAVQEFASYPNFHLKGRLRNSSKVSLLGSLQGWERIVTLDIRECVDRMVAASPVPLPSGCAEVWIAWAGSKLTLFRAPGDIPISQLVSQFLIGSRTSLAAIEVRCNGKPIDTTLTVLHFASSVIRVFLPGLPGGGKSHPAPVDVDHSGSSEDRAATDRFIAHCRQRHTVASSLDHLLELRRTPVATSVRVQTLLAQGTLWGDDEILFHLECISNTQPDELVIPVDPLITSALLSESPHCMLRSWLFDRVNLDAECVLATALRLDDHWIPIIWHLHRRQVDTASCDTTEATQRYVQQATSVLLQATGFHAGHSNHRVARPWCAGLQNACGAQAIAWIRCAIGPLPNPGDLTHASLRTLFLRSIAGCEYVPQVHYLAGGKFNPLKAGLAQSLIDAGQPIRQVAKLVDTLHDAIPNQELGNILNMPRLEERSAALTDAATKHKVDLSSSLSGASRSKGKGKGAKSAKPAKSFHRDTPLPSVCDLTLHANYFQTSSGEPIPVITELNTKAYGVALVSPTDLIPWLSANAKVADELAALTLDGIQPDQWPAYKCAWVTCPATDRAGNTVILSGLLTQLGEKPVTCPPSQCSIVKEEVVQCHITVCRGDFTEHVWQQILQAPAKTILSRITHEPVRSAIQSVWGRSFRVGQKACKPQDADSVRIWVHIPIQFALRLLQDSGFVKMNISQRDSTGLPDHQFTMIWLKCNREELEPKLLSLPHVGYIASDRGLGVRFSRANLKAAWASLKPGIAFEEPVEIKLLFKLSALPPATTAEGLRVLATETGWDMRPLKRINASTWLIGASKPFKSDYICVEGATILIKSVQPHGSRQPRGAILASTGSRPDMPPAGSTSSTDPWMKGQDPWAKAAARVAPPPVAPSQGPLADKLQAQDLKIESLEKKVSDLSANLSGRLDSQHSELSKKLENQQSKQEADMLTLSHKVTHDLHQLQQGMQQSFSESLAAALQQQSSDLLKAIKGSRPSPREELDPQKKPKLDS